MDFHLANVLIAVLQQEYFGISWVPHPFQQQDWQRGIRKGLLLYKAWRKAVHAVEKSSPLSVVTIAFP